MERSDWPPMASCIAALSLGSTWKVSAMHDCATSMLSASSGERVPSLRDVERKSIIARARRFLEGEVEVCYYVSSRF